MGVPGRRLAWIGMAGRQPAARCAAIPYRLRDGVLEFLLVTRTVSPGWIVPKGRIEPELGVRESARREALEEGGVEGDIEDEPFGTYRQDGPGGPLVTAYLMPVTREHDVWDEADRRKRAWVSIGDVHAKVIDPDLLRLLLAAGASITTGRRHADPVIPPATPASREPARSRGTGLLAGLSHALTRWRRG